jgi:hypothetical protein
MTRKTIFDTKLVGEIKMSLFEKIIDRLRRTRDVIFKHWVLSLLAIPGLIIVFFLTIFLFPGLAYFFHHDGYDTSDKYTDSPENTALVLLDQGWGEGFRQGYYFTPQGSQIIPLDMALSLEGAGTQQLFFGESGLAVTQFGYIPYASTQPSDDNIYYPNKYGLPVGFTIDGFIEARYRNSSKDETMMLGINCAACHTSNMMINGQTVRIDGNQGMGDFMGLFTAMDSALFETRYDPIKFDRFMTRQTALLANDAQGRDGQQRMVDNLEILTAQTKALIEAEEKRAIKQGDLQRAFIGNVNLEDLRNMTPAQRENYIRDRVMMARMDGVIARRTMWQERNTPDVEGGHGRVDAFGVIFNQVVGRDIHMDSHELGNVVTPNAPVSYPVLWDTPHMGRVQWNGSANNVSRGGVLGRNLGQVLGVFGDAEVTRQKIGLGYCSTAKKTNLQAMDYWIRSLNSPKWSDPALASLLPALDPVLVDQGETVYKATCKGCHAVTPEDFRDLKPKKKAECDLPITIVDANIVKTDPATAATGVRLGAHTGLLEGLESKARKDAIMAPQEAHANVLREVVTRSILGTYQTVSCDGNFGPRSLITTTAGLGELFRAQIGMESKIDDGFDLNPAYEKRLQDGDKKTEEESDKRDKTSECSAEKTIYKFPSTMEQNVYHPFAYRARPLNGIWASAPYLHNGSVPTLADMLRPEDERPVTFHVGSTDFDPVTVGFSTAAEDGTFLFDTSEIGNRNTGHTFGTSLSPTDKAALLEYLKSL